MLQKITSKKYQQRLDILPKIGLKAENVEILDGPSEYRLSLIKHIKEAKKRIYLVALYLEQDDAGKSILSEIYNAKANNPELEIAILVDWHRAQRGRIGDNESFTNADWYCKMKEQHPNVSIPIYGIPVNTREAFGVLHLKGSVVDDTVLYTGASVNDVYLYQNDKYRYDRYHIIDSRKLADTLIDYVNRHLLSSGIAVNRLDDCSRPDRATLKKCIRQFRRSLRSATYHFIQDASNEELAVTPLVGLGKSSPLYKVIKDLFSATEEKLTICTPYFNLPLPLVKRIARLLKQGKKVELIVGDKRANDFYIPEDQPFQIISAIPYLYEKNLRKFIHNLQEYVDKGQLIIRLWKHEDHTYHLKGVWSDEKWMLATGNNLNPRAINLDLENGLLIHDPKGEIRDQITHELELIRTHTTPVTHYSEIPSESTYPQKVHKLLRRLRRAGIDKIVSRIL